MPEGSGCWTLDAMPAGYGTYCPVALASETLGERWTILVITTLIDGVTRFNDMQRAMPRISPSVLAQRLRSLEEAGIVTRKRSGEGHEYELTEAGRELEPIIMEIAYWGQRWARDMEPDDLNPLSLAWSMHLRMNTEAMPPGRTVLEFELSGGEPDPSRFWLVNNDGVVDVCSRYPGFEADVRVVSDLQRFVEAWRGFRSLRAEVESGRIQVEGPRPLKRAFPDWLLLSMAAHVERRRTGRERATARRHGASRG